MNRYATFKFESTRLMFSNSKNRNYINSNFVQQWTSTVAENWHMTSFFFIYFTFCLFSFVIFVLFFHFFIFFILFLFSFCFHFVHFHYLIFLIVFFFHFSFFFFIYFRFLKWHQTLETKKTTWTRADIAPKMNQYGQRLTYACTAAVCYIKRCKKSQYFTCATWKAMKHSLLFIKKHGTRPASFSGY